MLHGEIGRNPSECCTILLPLLTKIFFFYSISFRLSKLGVFLVDILWGDIQFTFNFYEFRHMHVVVFFFFIYFSDTFLSLGVEFAPGGHFFISLLRNCSIRCFQHMSFLLLSENKLIFSIKVHILNNFTHKNIR